MQMETQPAPLDALVGSEDGLNQVRVASPLEIVSLLRELCDGNVLLNLIANDRTGTPLSCPSCSGPIERTPNDIPAPPRSHVTLRCRECGRVARYIAGAA